MAVLGTLHADQIGLSFRMGGSIRKAGDFAFLTDTNVAAADTKAGIVSAMNAAVVHADVTSALHREQRAFTMGSDSGEFTDALILALTTVEGLVGLTYAGSPAVNRDLLIG